MSKPKFIAEVKVVSPFGFKSNYDAVTLTTMALQYGDWISIHVDPLWRNQHDGAWALDYIKTCVKNGGHRASKLLAKGLHKTDGEICDSMKAGADYVLVVGRMPNVKYLPNCLLEPLNSKQLYMDDYVRAVNESAGLVLNRRDLLTGLERSKLCDGPHSWMTHWTCVFDTDIKILRKFIKVPIIQASGIKSSNDILKGIDGYIVGENLPQFIINQRINKLYDYYGEEIR